MKTTTSLPAQTAEPSLDLKTTAWIAVVRAYNECQATLLARLAPFGITLLQHEIMLNLLRTQGLTQRALAERCFSAKSGISMLLDKMQKDGLVTRQPHPDDSRARIITLSPKGRDLAQRLSRMQVEVIEEMTGTYSPADLERLVHQMNETAERLQQMRQRPQV